MNGLNTQSLHKTQLSQSMSHPSTKGPGNPFNSFYRILLKTQTPKNGQVGKNNYLWELMKLWITAAVLDSFATWGQQKQNTTLTNSRTLCPCEVWTICEAMKPKEWAERGRDTLLKGTAVLWVAWSITHIDCIYRLHTLYIYILCNFKLFIDLQ